MRTSSFVTVPAMSATRIVLAGLSASLLLIGGSATTVTAAPINVPWSPDAAADTEIQFESDGHTFYGSLRAPVGEIRGAALLLPGSGATDRNGNQAGGITPNTLAFIADGLAQRGVATFRFDKTGSGRTGLEGLDPADPPGFFDQVDDAEAALVVLKDRTGVSSENVAVLGHSEGALTALSLKERALEERGEQFGSLGLLEPAALRFLDLLSLQLNSNLDRQVAGGQLTPADADANRARLAETIAALRGGQPLPYPQDPALASIGMSDLNAKFLSEVDSVDAVSIASTLPASTKVLLTCSKKDLNVSCDQIDRLHAALAGTQVDYARLLNASHSLGELGPLPATGVDLFLPLPQSCEFRGVLDAWAGTAFS